MVFNLNEILLYHYVKFQKLYVQLHNTHPIYKNIVFKNVCEVSFLLTRFCRLFNFVKIKIEVKTSNKSQNILNVQNEIKPLDHTCRLLTLAL